MHLRIGPRETLAASGAAIAPIRPRSGLAAQLPLAVSADEAVAHRAWREARDRVLSVVLARPCLVLILGKAGTGKTLLLQDLARTLRAAGADVWLQPRGDLPLDAAQSATGDALGSAPDRRRVVLIDEADRMTEAALDRLGRFGECAVVLAGLVGVEGDRLPDAKAVVVSLAPLAPDEVGSFLAEYLALAGLDLGVMGPGAVARLAAHSGGVPRVLNMLARAAVFLASADGGRVEAAHVDQAASLRSGEPEAIRLAPTPAAPAQGKLSSRHLRAALSVSLGIAAACAGLAWWHGTAQPSAAMRIASAAALPRFPAPPAAIAAMSAPSAPTLLESVAPAAPEPTLFVPDMTVPHLSSRPAPAAPLMAVAAPPTEALPSGTPAQVALRYARGSASAEARAAGVALALRAAGFAVDGPAAVPLRDARPGARYFFAEDQDAANAVLQAAGMAGRSNQMAAARFGDLPRPGLVELVVPPGQAITGGRPEAPSSGRS